MTLNFSPNNLEASSRINDQRNENIFVNSLKTKDYPNKVNIYLQIELNNFVNLIAENIKPSSIDNDNKLESLEITSNNQYQSENKLLNEIRAVRTQLSERVGVLEKWRWLIIGGSIIIGLMMSNPDSMLMKMF